MARPQEAGHPITATGFGRQAEEARVLRRMGGCASNNRWSSCGKRFVGNEVSGTMAIEWRMYSALGGFVSAMWTEGACTWAMASVGGGPSLKMSSTGAQRSKGVGTG